MATKKPRLSRQSSGDPIMVVFEEIKSQNRATIEAVETTRDTLKAEIQHNRTEVVARLDTLEATVRQNGADIRQVRNDIAALKEQMTRIDVMMAVDYRERLVRLEERVEAIERRSA
jgi:predicted nuclease with TOPRIM domain